MQMTDRPKAGENRDQKKSRNAPAQRTGAKKYSEFDKYFYYKESVQSPETDAEFLMDTYGEIRGKAPEVLREDFCGTFAVCCEWTKLSETSRAFGVDIDEEPTSYGREKYLSLLNSGQQERVNIRHGNVLEAELPKADISCSLNFSYFCFKERNIMKKYLERTLLSLNEGGVHVLDCFGGGKCHEPNVEETVDEEQGYSYFWDQDSFNPLTHDAQFYIHFQRKGERKREKVFSYDWRLWTLPEIRDLLLEVGYSDVHFYWEGTDEDGDGNGEFVRTDDPKEDCEAWVAYIAAIK